MVDVSMLETYRFAKSGLFEDLLPWMESDPRHRPEGLLRQHPGGAENRWEAVRPDLGRELPGPVRQRLHGRGTGAWM